MSVTADETTNERLTFTNIAEGVGDEPQIPNFNGHAGGLGAVLRQTQPLLSALHYAAQAEMTERGLDLDTHANPIDALLGTPPPRHPIFDQMKRAIQQASSANAFGSNPTPSRPFAPGNRVRIINTASSGLPARYAQTRATIDDRPATNPDWLRITTDDGRTWNAHPEDLEHA